MKVQPRVVVAHPGGQHAARVAEALDRAGMLEAFISPGTFPMHRRLAQTAARAYGRVVQGDESAFLASRVFDRHVAARLRDLTFDYFIGYEVACRDSFRLCAERGVPRLLDHAAEHWSYQRRVFEQERREGRLSRHLSGASLVRCERIKEEELRLADAMLVLSTFARSTFIEAGVDPSRLHLLSAGVDPRQFPPKDSYRASGPLKILFAGGLIAKKGVTYLLEAFRRLGIPGAELTMIGPSDLGSSGSPAGLPGVRVIPRVDQATLAGYYRDADVFVLPSLMESFGMVVLESMASGTPVIISSSVGAADVVRDGIDGFVIPPRDPEALAGRIRWCHEHRPRLEAMGRSSHARAGEFGWDRHARGVVSIVRDLWQAGLPGRPGSRS